VELLMDRQKKNPLDEIIPAVSKEEVLQMQQEVENLYIDRKIVEYVTKLMELSRKQKLIQWSSRQS